MAGSTIALFSVGVHFHQISPRETFEDQKSFPKGILLTDAQSTSSDTYCGSFPSPGQYAIPAYPQDFRPPRLDWDSFIFKVFSSDIDGHFTQTPSIGNLLINRPDINHITQDILVNIIVA
jgi:hypothetical protein